MRDRILALRLDLPMDESEAKQRGISSEHSRLVVTGETQVLVELLGRASGERSMSFHAIGEFTRLEDLKDRFENAGVRVDTASGLVSTAFRSSIETILSMWRAEILAIMLCDLSRAVEVISALPKLEPAWWKFSREGYEAPYLKQLGVTDVLCFYSATLSALEFFGGDGAVMSLLDHARAIQDESAHGQIPS
ncbi:MAG: hypothetical protein IPJ33_01680 [Gammaproteobacteria bacterium]|nr:hypothetical protein [Gammaproteobacteria bacterium]MBK6583937.1 hypothetical protein [Gammaproteobacteria bacterium]MBK7727233.1 hypothetical protein [Gammaproteobacteria bacterium]